jgi:sugar-specific transcriptional regulator TrmB
MGYLICNKCKNYYELQTGESPENFDLKCNCGGKLEFVRDIDTHKRFAEDKTPIEFTKKDLELIEKIRTYRSDKTLIKTLSVENVVLKERNQEIQDDFVNLNKELIDQEELIKQIRELKMEKKDLKQELVQNADKYKFVVTSSDSINTVYGEIRNSLSEAKKEVLVCSPWITYLVNEFKGFPQGISLKIITNFRKEDVERGITDVDKLRALQDLGAEIRYNNNLHAKMVFIDGKTAIISSANLTKRGLSVNYEAGAVIKDLEKVEEAVKFFESVWKESETLTPELIRRYV